MSNSLAIATVTAAVADIIRRSVQSLERTSGPIELRFGRPPSDQPPWVGVNIYLFRALPNAARRNDTFPVRNGTGAVVRTPRTVIDLEYLVSFYGDEVRFEPHRLLAATMIGLETEALLTQERLRETIASGGPNGPLWNSNVDRQSDPVRLNPLPLDMDVLSRMWSTFDVPFALTIGIIASSVTIEAEVTGRTEPPVSGVAFGFDPQRISISALRPAELTYAAGAKLDVLTAERRRNTTIVINDEAVTTDVNDDCFTAVIPAHVRAGINHISLRSTTPEGMEIASDGRVLTVHPALTAKARFASIANPRIGETPETLDVVHLGIAPDLATSGGYALALYPASAAALRPYTLAPCLERHMAADIVADLDSCMATPRVRTRFESEGLPLGPDPRITVDDIGYTWNVRHEGGRYRVIRDGERLVVRYGLPIDDERVTCAFDARPVEDGHYICNVFTVGDARCRTPMETAADGAYSGPQLPVQRAHAGASQGR